jgi:hypothetical protein
VSYTLITTEEELKVDAHGYGRTEPCDIVHRKGIEAVVHWEVRREDTEKISFWLEDSPHLDRLWSKVLDLDRDSGSHRAITEISQFVRVCWRYRGMADEEIGSRIECSLFV